MKIFKINSFANEMLKVGRFDEMCVVVYSVNTSTFIIATH